MKNVLENASVKKFCREEQKYNSHFCICYNIPKFANFLSHSRAMVNVTKFCISSVQMYSKNRFLIDSICHKFNWGYNHDN